MTILVGKGGNQNIPITDETVSRVHCKIELLDGGYIAVTNLSISGTWVNDVKVVSRTLVNPTDVLRLGPHFTIKVADVIESEDYSVYTCHQVVSKKYSTAESLQAFLAVSSLRAADQLAPYTIPVAKSTLANFFIDAGQYRKAQSLIYEAGDEIYAMQDGSSLLQGVYATMLVICARLYTKVGRPEKAYETIQAAMSIFERLTPDTPGNSHEQREEAEMLMSQINSLMEIE